MTNFDLIAEAIEMMNAGNNEQAIARLKQFTALNTPKVKGGGKVKIYDWVHKDDRTYPNMNGVHHDSEEKVAVATDMKVLLVSKADFAEEHAGKTVDKKGDYVKGNFPQWKRVFWKDLAPYKVNRDKIAEMLTKMRCERKIDKTAVYLAFNIGAEGENPFYLTPEICKLLITLPDGTFYICNTTTGNPYELPLHYESADGNYKALMMPIRVDKEKIGIDMIPV